MSKLENLRSNPIEKHTLPWMHLVLLPVIMTPHWLSLGYEFLHSWKPIKGLRHEENLWVRLARSSFQENICITCSPERKSGLTDLSTLFEFIFLLDVKDFSTESYMIGFAAVVTPTTFYLKFFSTSNKRKNDFELESQNQLTRFSS